MNPTRKYFNGIVSNLKLMQELYSKDWVGFDDPIYIFGDGDANDDDYDDDDDDDDNHLYLR